MREVLANAIGGVVTAILLGVVGMTSGILTGGIRLSWEALPSFIVTLNPNQWRATIVPLIVGVPLLLISMHWAESGIPDRASVQSHLRELLVRVLYSALWAPALFASFVKTAIVDTNSSSFDFIQRNVSPDLDWINFLDRQMDMLAASSVGTHLGDPSTFTSIYFLLIPTGAIVGLIGSVLSPYPPKEKSRLLFDGDRRPVALLKGDSIYTWKDNRRIAEVIDGRDVYLLSGQYVGELYRDGIVDRDRDRLLRSNDPDDGQIDATYRLFRQ